MKQYLINLYFFVIVGYFYSTSTSGASPSEIHHWKSIIGTTLEARATSVTGDSVTLQTQSGKVVTLKIEMLIETDRALLKTYFPDINSLPPQAIAAQGQVLGPIEVAGSHYFYYIPKSLKPGRRAPLCFVTCAWGGSAQRLALLQPGAEICSWIIAISVECMNNVPEDTMRTHAKHCLDHLLANYPIDKDRVYFSGNSGGARAAFTNSVKYKGAGVLAVIAGAAPGEIQKKMDYFFISGSTDFNRYDTAKSFKAAKSSAAFRFHPSNHEDGPVWLQTEGMIWLQSRWELRNKRTSPEYEEFENAALTWAEGLSQYQDYVTGWWANYFLTTNLTPTAKVRATKISLEHGNKPTTIAYTDSIKALEKLAIDVLASEKSFSPDCFDHTSPAIQKAVNTILDKNVNTPWIKDILTALKNKTQKG